MHWFNLGLNGLGDRDGISKAGIIMESLELWLTCMTNVAFYRTYCTCIEHTDTPSEKNVKNDLKYREKIVVANFLCLSSGR